MDADLTIGIQKENLLLALMTKSLKKIIYAFKLNYKSFMLLSLFFYQYRHVYLVVLCISSREKMKISFP